MWWFLVVLWNKLWAAQVFFLFFSSYKYLIYTDLILSFIYSIFSWYLLIILLILTCYLLDTLRYFMILFGTFWYFLVLIGTFWYILVRFGTSWYLLDTFWYSLLFFCFFGTFWYYRLLQSTANYYRLKNVTTWYYISIYTSRGCYNRLLYFTTDYCRLLQFSAGSFMLLHLTDITGSKRFKFSLFPSN